VAHELAQLRPDLLHMDEEPYNLATWLALRAAARSGVVSTFFTWQNLYRRYPPPFRWFEQANYRRTTVAIAGNAEAATVMQRKGFGGQVVVIPQFGIDPQLFQPAPQTVNSLTNSLQIGYAGGLLPEKGADLLLRACAELQGDWQLHLAGTGSEQAKLQTLAQTLGIAARLHWHGQIASTAMPAFYQKLDVFVLPSRTTSTWKEQFGRVLVEAMACEVAVIGSNSGEIPNVIGSAGLIFAEDDANALRAGLQRLLDQPETRQQLGKLGRQRILEQFTMASIAQRTVATYQAALAGRGKR